MIGCLGAISIPENFDKTYDVLDELMGLDQLRPASCSHEDDDDHQSDVFIQEDEDEDNYDEYVHHLHRTIEKLYELIDHFREEMTEKNLLIRALTFSNANGGPKVDFDLMETEATCPLPRNSSIDHEASIFSEHSATPDNESSDEDGRPSDKPGDDGDLDTSATSESSSSSDTGSLFKFQQKFPWEKHNNGVGSQILDKMNYKGGGLGKDENGIGEPIHISPAEPPKKKKSKEDKQQKEVTFVREGEEPRAAAKKKLYIISDSMLNGMDEKRLSQYKYEVKLSCHGGCTVGCAYMHMEPMVKYKPDIVLVHLGTNDCASKWSYEVYQELQDFFIYINSFLPEAEIFISLPTIRTDNTKANATLTNFNTQLQKYNEFKFLDNSGINENHLGKKGLHLNAKGIKQMAKNIIYFIKYN